MKKPSFTLSITLSLFWYLTASAIQIIKAPSVQTKSSSENLSNNKSLLKNRCADLQLFSTNKNIPSVSQIIGFADTHFERRAWSKEFIAERLKLAEKFPKSDYYYAQSINGKMIGTIAVTFAEYKEDTIPTSKYQHRENNQSHEYLPMEDSLSIDPLDRPLMSPLKNQTIAPDSKDHKNLEAKGLIVEFRTYAIDKSHHDDARLALLFSSINKVYQLFATEYFELLDSEVIYTYGDEVSVKMYKKMGFIIKNSEPVLHAGSKWWVLTISPNRLRDLKNNLANFNEFLVGNDKEFLLPSGKTAAFNHFVAFAFDHGKKQVLTGRSLSEDTEIEDGLWAKKGSNIDYTEEGLLLRVSALAQPYQIKLPDSINLAIIAHENSEIEFFPVTFFPRVIKQIKEPFEISPNIWVRANDQVEWFINNSNEIDWYLINSSFLNPKYISGFSYQAKTRPLVPPATTPSYIGTRVIAD